jgi:hypothetical protein
VSITGIITRYLKVRRKSNIARRGYRPILIAAADRGTVEILLGVAALLFVFVGDVFFEFVDETTQKAIDGLRNSNRPESFVAYADMHIMATLRVRTRMRIRGGRIEAQIGSIEGIGH